MTDMVDDLTPDTTTVFPFGSNGDEAEPKETKPCVVCGEPSPTRGRYAGKCEQHRERPAQVVQLPERVEPEDEQGDSERITSCLEELQSLAEDVERLEGELSEAREGFREKVQELVQLAE